MTNSQRSGGSRLVAMAALGGALALMAAACSSSSSTRTSSAPTGAKASSSSSSSPAAKFSTATVAGLGTVVVDGRGRTVYVLTADGHTNATCDDASGCTKVWPDLPFPDGVTSANAGSGVQASLLGSQKLSDGETYPTYHGWLMYEFVRDTAAGQGHGEGIHSFGGTWYALSPTGDLVMGGGASTATTASSSGY